MAMSDPIADMLSRIRNGLNAGHDRVDIPASRVKEQICKVMQAEGYIEGYKLVEDNKQGVLQVKLRYTPQRAPVIRELRRVSRPSLRVYRKSRDLEQFRSGLGISIISTSHGVMTSKQARDAHVGGEILCEVW